MSVTNPHIVITPEMKTAAYRTWQTIGGDIEACCEDGPPLKSHEKAEAILDADYMRTYGGEAGKQAADAFDALCQNPKIKLKDVYKALAEALYL